MVKNKKRLSILLTHVLLVTLASFVALGQFHWQLLAGVFVTHVIIDAIKIFGMKDDFRSFAIAQSIHLAAIAIFSKLCPGVISAGWWNSWLGAANLHWYLQTNCVISGLILLIPVGGILIGKFTEPFSSEIRKNKVLTGESKPEDNDAMVDGLTNGGKYIGCLERLMTMILILIGQPTGIGFVIAAKSILRFGEIKESKHRKVAEYIIIGTFLSFGWALSVSVLMQKGIEYWSPPIDTDPKPLKVIIEPAENNVAPPPVTP
jgi:hypothetical protein